MASKLNCTAATEPVPATNPNPESLELAQYRWAAPFLAATSPRVDRSRHGARALLQSHRIESLLPRAANLPSRDLADPFPSLPPFRLRSAASCGIRKSNAQ